MKNICHVLFTFYSSFIQVFSIYGPKVEAVISESSHNLLFFSIKWRSFTILRQCSQEQKQLFRLCQKVLNKCNKDLIDIGP